MSSGPAVHRAGIPETDKPLCDNRADLGTFDKGRRGRAADQFSAMRFAEVCTLSSPRTRRPAPTCRGFHGQVLGAYASTRWIGLSDHRAGLCLGAERRGCRQQCPPQAPRHRRGHPGDPRHVRRLRHADAGRHSPARLKFADTYHASRRSSSASSTTCAPACHRSVGGDARTDAARHRRHRAASRGAQGISQRTEQL
jgi:hypothetical protein